MALLNGGNGLFGFVLANSAIVDVEVHHEPVWTTVPLRKLVFDRRLKRGGNAPC